MTLCHRLLILARMFSYIFMRTERPVTLSPQAKRLARLHHEGISQRNVLVHTDNQESFEVLRSAFAEPSMAPTLTTFAQSLTEQQPINVSKIRQLSPFRYPGGKTWLVPVVREWMRSLPFRPRLLLEPFAGGAIIGLTAAAENWVDHVRLVELDDEIAAVWSLTIDGTDTDFEKFLHGIETFPFDEQHVKNMIDSRPRTAHRRALRTIVKNRAQRGGIMAPGAGVMKTGEAGRGIASRWYPTTLVTRLQTIRAMRSKITFVHADGFDELATHAAADTALFIDPPYTAGGKKAGNRLYTHNTIDHDRLFEIVAATPSPAMLTYDDNDWVRTTADQYGFTLATSVMQSTHLVKMHELVVLKEAS